MTLASDKAETDPRRRKRAVLGISVLIGGAVACVFAVLAAEQVAPPQAAIVTAPGPETRLLAPSEVIVLADRELRDVLPVSGEVQPVSRVTISAQVAGLAETVAFQPGETVAAGAVVLRIAPDDYRLALDAEEATLASLMAERLVAGATLERVNRLAGSGAASEASREEAQAAVDMLEAGIAGTKTRIHLARINLDRSLIRAPFAGTLASRTVEPGQMVQAGDTLFTLVDLSVMRLEVLVPVDRATALAPGQEAVLHSPYQPGQQIAARVQRIGPEVISGTRSVPVWLEIDTPVTPGTRWHDGAQVEITAGLRMGETVVALPLTGLRPGDTVEIGGN